MKQAVVGLVNRNKIAIMLAELDDADLIDDEIETENEIVITGEVNGTLDSNKPFKMPNLENQTTAQIKKENLEKLQETINSVASGRLRSMSTSSASSTSFPTFNASTFAKIKASNNSKNNNNINNKSKQSLKNQKHAKPDYMSKEEWKVELKRLKEIDKAQEDNKEFIEMNAAALKASQQFKRPNSKSDLHEQNKKPLVGDYILD